MTQPGIPTIYYGDEIGMRFVPDTPAKEGSTLLNITAVNAGAANGERAGTRTPMQWDDSHNAGFSTASPDDLYLPLDPDLDRPSVAAQEEDANSLLNFVRKLLQLRREHSALGADASFDILNPPGVEYPLTYLRQGGFEKCLITVNPTALPRKLEVPCSADVCRSVPQLRDPNYARW